MSKLRILSIFMAVGLLAGAFGVGPVLAGQSDTTGIDTLDASYAPAQVTLDDEEVNWTDSAGESISFVNDADDVNLYVRDDALGTKSGDQVAEWKVTSTGTGLEKTGVGESFNVATGAIGIKVTSADWTFTRTTKNADGDTIPSTYNNTDPAKTPVADFEVEIQYAADTGYRKLASGGSSVNPDNGTFALVGGTPDTVKALKITFSYHEDDSHAERAKVYSTSDPNGEFVTISEVAGVGKAGTAAYTSDYFHGKISLSDTADAQNPDGLDDGGVYKDGGVWVQDGDTLTVEYQDSDGNRISTDTVTVDAVAPSIENLKPADGTITNSFNPTVTFSVSDDGSSIHATDLTQNNTIITLGFSKDEADKSPTKVKSGVSFVAVGAGQYNVIYAESRSWIETYGPVSNNSAFHLIVTAKDNAGNVARATSEVTIDRTTPGITAAVTGTGWNVGSAKEESGMANAIRLRLSEIIDEDSVSGSDFEVDGVAAASAIVGAAADGDDADNPARHIYLTLASALAPDAQPEVKIVGNVSDLAGNNVKTDVSGDSTRTALDKLAPNLVSVSRDTALLVKDQTVTVTVVVDEKLRSGGAVVSVNGPDNSGANGTLSTSSNQPLTRTAELKVRGSDATGMYGVSVQVTDTGDNATNNLTSVSDEEATLAVEGDTYVVTLAKGPIGDKDFDGEIDGDDVTLTGVTHTVTIVDASARTVTLTSSDAKAGAAVKVSYSYVPADYTFEIDQQAPTVTFTPAADADVPNPSPFVTLEFDDDTYPGDNYTDVTLTSASLEMPDGTTEDVQSGFVLESDGVTYVWAASGLALGGHTLSVTAEDVAGNEVDESVSFSIVEKPAFSISLRPGWNLVSLPGNPASTAIEDVITNESIQSVLTYDPSTPTKWLTATREDGVWKGNLSHISGKLGYWVQTSTFDPLEVDIPSLTSGGVQLPPTHSLLTGWNLVAVTVLDTTVKKVDATEYLGSFWLRAVTYDATKGIFVSLGPDDTDAELTVGNGYFVWMTEPDTIVP